MNTDYHDLIIQHDPTDETWYPECACGWEGNERNAEIDAIGDWEDHYDETFFEATKATMDEAAMDLSPPEPPVHTPIPDDRFEIVKRTDTCTTMRLKKATQ